MRLRFSEFLVLLFLVLSCSGLSAWFAYSAGYLNGNLDTRSRPEVSAVKLESWAVQRVARIRGIATTNLAKPQDLAAQRLADIRSLLTELPSRLSSAQSPQWDSVRTALEELRTELQQHATLLEEIHAKVMATGGGESP